MNTKNDMTKDEIDNLIREVDVLHEAKVGRVDVMLGSISEIMDAAERKETPFGEAVLVKAQVAMIDNKPRGLVVYDRVLLVENDKERIGTLAVVSHPSNPNEISLSMEIA